MPNDWAATQTELATALVAQASRHDGAAGAGLLTDAIAQYRRVLQVHIREYQPQPWATAQMLLGAALVAQGIRQGGNEGRRLLTDAVSALKGALKVRLRQHLP